MEKHINPPCCNNCDLAIDGHPHVQDLEKRLEVAEMESLKFRQALHVIRADTKEQLESITQTLTLK